MTKKILSVVLSLLMLLSAFFGVSASAYAGAEIKTPVLYAEKVKKPAKVKKLKVKAECKKVTLTWKSQNGVKGYIVYTSASKNGKYKKLATVKKNTYTAKKLKVNKNYFYKVRAYNKKKKKKIYGAYSAVKKAHTAHAPSSSWFIDRKATCVKTEIKSNTCVYCGKEYTVEGEKDMTTHIYVASDVAATDRFESYKVYRCKLCGDTFTSKIKEHKFDNGKVTAPTCTERGYTRYTCTNSKCSYHYDANYTDMIPHDYEEVVLNAPTCTAKGEAKKVCTVCKDETEPYELGMIPHTFETKTVHSNCTDDGYFINVCTVCGYEDETSKVINENDPAAGIEHEFEVESVEATCTEGAYNINVCKICGFRDEKNKEYTSEPLPHNLVETIIQPTCTEQGYTVDICADCQYVDESSKRDYTDSLGHDYSLDYITDEDGFRRYYCTHEGCEDYVLDTTCYIDIKKETVSNSNYAVFNKSSTNTTDVNDKLDLTPHPDGIVDFEIVGTRENLTIDINATARTEVKLAGVQITNNGRDCINVKNKVPAVADENGEVISSTPKVYISAKDLSENKLITTTSGNAIDSNCPVELRGHGRLTIKTASTAINNEAKLTIKNLTLDITSENRGIDTKSVTQVQGISGMVEEETYFNIEIEPKADITIKSADDGIRCKNMEILPLSTGDTATVMNITSTLGDGIQIEGNKGFVASSGKITITAGKYAFNCSASLITITPPATVTATGTSGYSKP